MQKTNYKKLAYQGIISDNPTFKLALGLCPTLAMTNTFFSGLGIAVSTAIVLILTNIVISLLKRFIADEVRIPTFIIIIATIATSLEMLMSKYLPELHATLGIFIPLIVVNCIVFAKAEMFASKNGVLTSAMDGLFTGTGFVLSLAVISAIREILGKGTFWGVKVLPSFIPKFQIFSMPAGGFLILGLLMALYTFVTMPKDKVKTAVKNQKTKEEQAI